MKKLLFSALVLLVSLSSCVEKGTGGTTMYPYIRGIKTTHHTTGAVVRQTMEYGDLNILKKMTIDGDTITSIEYKYEESKFFVTTNYTNHPQKIDTLILNDQKMAYRQIVNKVEVPYSIQYDANGFRTSVGDVKLDLTDSNYTRALNSKGEPIAIYSYSNVINTLGVQQFPAYGNYYDWATYRFGRQSMYLISSSIVKEDGVDKTYGYTYQVTVDGIMEREEIKIDNKPFITREFEYILLPVQLY